MPVAKSVFAPKLPVPSPSSTEPVLQSPLAIARSGLSSALKSAVVTEKGFVPAVKSVFAPKLPVPSPSRTETVLESELATARSGYCCR